MANSVWVIPDAEGMREFMRSVRLDMLRKADQEICDEEVRQKYRQAHDLGPNADISGAQLAEFREMVIHLALESKCISGVDSTNNPEVSQ